MIGHWILDADGEPREERDLLTWARWFEESREARTVARDELPGDVTVSTVFLGLDHSFALGGQPVLFETMVFGGPLDLEMERYHTREAALHGHAAMDARVTGKGEQP